MSAGPLSLKLNPSARISICDDEPTPSFLVEAPIKGASLSTVRVCAENLPGAHAFLCSILIDGHKDAQIGALDAAELRRIGLFVSANSMPHAVTYNFPLRDSSLPATLRCHSSMDIAARKPAGSPVLRLPEDWPKQALWFEPHHHGSVWAPIRFACGIGFDGHTDNERREVWHQEAVLDGEATHCHFQRDGFAILENLLPAVHVSELGQYFQALAAQGFLPCDQLHGALRHFSHNHPVANFWHDQLNERVSQLAGQRTKPSYSFVSLYIAGGDLFWHTDRPPCEYTITLLLDYAPLDVDSRSPWALKIKDRDGTTHSLHLRVGEALILKGRELVHGREVLPNGHRSASLLFHFVNEDFDGDLG